MSIFDLFDKIAKDKDPVGVKPVTWIVAGLGNPGKEYMLNRHNAGFMAVDYLSQKFGIAVRSAKFHAIVGDGMIGENRVLIMKPQTMMNNSGISIRDAAEFYKIPSSNIIIIYDDVNFDAGKLRIKRKGSDGGHNGIKSIIYHLNTDVFPRIKLGVGQKPHPDYDLAAWVLSDIPEPDRKEFFRAVEKCAEAVKLITEGNTEKAMQECN